MTTRLCGRYECGRYQRYNACWGSNSDLAGRGGVIRVVTAQDFEGVVAPMVICVHGDRGVW